MSFLVVENLDDSNQLNYLDRDFNNGPANQGNNWNKPRDYMDKRRS